MADPVLSRLITVTLTVEESRALRMASIFGGPTPPHPVLEDARRKLGEAEVNAEPLR